MLQLSIVGSGVEPREVLPSTSTRARRVEALRALDHALLEFRGSFVARVVRMPDCDTVEVTLPWPSRDAFVAMRTENWHLLRMGRDPRGAPCSVTVQWSAHRRPRGEWHRWDGLRVTRLRSHKVIRLQGGAL